MKETKHKLNEILGNVRHKLEAEKITKLEGESLNIVTRKSKCFSVKTAVLKLKSWYFEET